MEANPLSGRIETQSKLAFSLNASSFSGCWPIQKRQIFMRYMGYEPWPRIEIVWTCRLKVQGTDPDSIPARRRRGDEVSGRVRWRSSWSKC